jgi:hypothetical protein
MSSLLQLHFKKVRKMGLVIEQPEELNSGGNFVNKPGVYHMLVISVDENPAKDDGTPLDMLKVGLSCLTGTNPDQKDRSFELKLWHPKPSDTNDMAKKKQTRFCLATCLIGHHQPGARVSVEPTDAVGRQLVCKLSWQRVNTKKQDDKGKDIWVDSDEYVELHYSDIWHVDDMDVAKISGLTLDAASLAMIPSELRKPVTQAAAVGTSAVAPVSSTRSGVDLSAV